MLVTLDDARAAERAAEDMVRVHSGLDLPGRHWAHRRSYYLDAFQGAELRRPKVLIITRSAKRAENTWKLAVHCFRETFNEDQLLNFLEVSRPTAGVSRACLGS